MEEEDFSSLPLEEKLLHKSWKARQQAYEELSRKFRIADSSKDDIFWDYFESVKKFPLEANAVAQEAAVSCLTAYLECCDASIGKKLRPEITTNVIEKGLSAMKAGTRTKTVELLMTAIELDVAEPVVTELTAFFSHKQPKLIAASINCLAEIVRCFGANVANAKSIIKVISGPFSHADKNVRSEATALVVELNKWLGISVLNLLNGLKPVQMKELQELCSQIPSFSPTPTRYLRSQKPVHIPEESKAMDTAEDYSREDAPMSLPSQVSQTAISGPVPIMDAYDLADSVDINTKLPQNLYEMLGSSSWKDRKEALETVLPLIKVPKICDNGRYGEFIDAICKRIGDVNVLVVILAAGCVEAMATGLRSNFGPYRSSVVSALLEKAKEKKQNVVDAIRSALDSLRFCIQQLNENFLEEVSPFIVHKNPSVRSESLLWLSRLMQSMHQVPSKKDCRSIVEAVIPAMDDGTTEVREASAVCLAWIQKFLGDAGVAPFFEKLDKIKLNKVKELSEKIHPAGKPSPSYTIAPAVKVAPTRPVPAPPVPAPQANRKIPAESQLTSESASKSRKMDIDEFSSSLSFSHSDEEAIRFFSEWFGETLCTELSDSVWKTRLTAIEQIYSKIDEASELPLGFSTELLTRFFSQKPSWKDSNFQVLGKVISCLIRAAKHQFYTREAASLAINGLVEKLSDPKLRNDCGELFLILAEQVPVGFVLMQVSGLARSQKSPKIQADIVKWLQSAVQAFGISGVQVQDLISICKLCLGNSNPTVRSVAIALAGTLRAFVGPDLRLLFNDVSTSLLAALDAEFNRIASEPAPVSSRQSLSRPMATSAPSVNATSNDIVEDLIPRTNITALINESLLAKLSDVSWKVRKSGLDEVTQILASANYRVKYTGYELFNSLKARLSDSNKNLSLQALEICGAVAEAMGSVFEKHLKTLLPPVLETLSDNKVQVRQAALKALDRFLLVSPISTFFSLIGLALIPDSPNTRKELLTWTAGVLSHQKQGSVIKEELLEIVGSIAGCLQDRSVEVRKAAQIMVSAMTEHVTVESLKKACSDQQPRSITSLLPLLEAARKTINSSSAPVPAIVTSHPNSVPQSAPRTPQRAMSVRHNRPITPIKPSASLQNLNDEVSKNPMDEFPLLTSDISGKSMRAEKDKGSARWSFDTPRKDIIDFLREQMLGNVSYSLVGKLFSDDFRDHIAAMNRFEEFINLASDDETKAKYVANLDLILKYLTLRFFDTNTSVLIKSLELTESIVSFMDNCNYRLSEYEASAFFPFLILKMGDGKEVMRTKIHSIFRQVCRIYPASKIFAYFMDGLKNKNSRTRSECLDELAKLLSRNGLSVLQPSRHLSAIGSLISDRDSQVRNAALNVLVQANQLMGPAALQKYLQGLSSKDLDMLDERLKRAAAGIKDIVVEKEENADMIDAPLPQVIENPVDVSSTALGINLSSMDYSNTGFPSPAPPTFRRNFEPSMLSNPLDHAIDQIQFSTDLVCIHALQTLETYLNNNEVDDDMRARINTLTHALIVRMKEATSTSYDVQEVAQMKSRLCRYVTNALVLITTNSSLCYELNEDVIELLVSETLSALVSERIRVFEDQEQLEKALNILIVKVLEGVPQNRSYSALLTVLREAFRAPPAESDKFPELVMKCLWKLTKQLSMNLQIAGRINVPELLAEVHSFLTSLPPIEWKMRSNEGLAFQDLPLRTVKTILHEIVQHCGIKVLNELALIPDPEDSFVLSYLKAMLQARGISEQEIIVHLNANDDLNMDVDQTGSSTDVEMNLDSSELSSEQITAFLREVCSQICSKPDTRLGLQQLYEFRSAHPYALEQINQFLAGLGDFFHKYISRSLERIEVENIQASSLKRSALNSSESGNTVEAYKLKLVQLRQQIFGTVEYSENSSNVISENQPPNSPSALSALRRANSHMDSPKMRSIRSNESGSPTKLSAAMDLATATVPPGSPSLAPASPSSILSLKERLARLRGESQLSQQ